MTPRSVSDCLREEYESLLPYIRRTAEELEAEVRHLLIPVMRHLASYERVHIKSRIKECGSAISALQRRDDWQKIDEPKTVSRSLRMLNDLAGIRILAFPKELALEIDAAVRERFPGWMSDPVPPIPGSAAPIALKYHGYCSPHCKVRAEIQILSMLVGMFWEVEHATLYKPGPELRGVEHSLKLQTCYAGVIRALEEFEREVEKEAQRRPKKVEERLN